MLRRLILSCALACGLLATQATASAASAEARVLAGKTGQNYRIVVKADRRGLKIQRFNARLNCRDGTLLILQESGFLRTPARRGGRFKDVQFGKTDTVRFQGRLRARSVRGRLRVNDRLNSGVRCSSRWIPFRATRRR